MTKQVFISYSGRDEFEASLLQYALERILENEGVVAWTFQRDQGRSERDIAQSLKHRVQESVASIFLVSPDTLDSGASQWMELAYADAFDVKTFILLHHLTFDELKQRAQECHHYSCRANVIPRWTGRRLLRTLESRLRGN